MDIQTGGSVRITKGGVGYSDVSVEMKSQVGKGIDFKIKIFGKTNV